MNLRPAVVLLVCLAACKSESAKPADKPATAGGAKKPPKTPVYDVLEREEFNRIAVRLNAPIYWMADANGNKAVDPDEVAALLFYPAEGHWVDGGKFTAGFDATYRLMVASKTEQPKLTPEETERRKLVVMDLDAGRATLVRTDLRGLSADEKKFVGHMLAASKKIDELYELTNGSAALKDKLVDKDLASQSLFRRNRGPRCEAPVVDQNPACSAIPGAPKPIVDVYPAAMQADPKFCETLAKRPDAKKLLGAFTVVREVDGKLVAVPYSKAYPVLMQAIAAELTAAADALPLAELALHDYLLAAAKAFGDDDWVPADEAWAKMNAENSKWYVRVGPDETYWEPCALKAGFHLAFARINQGSLVWQRKLVPVQQDMEAAIAERAGAPYKARTVTFHLPDFIDIVTNAGDDRGALGATIGQSLPNLGPVYEQGRGRTVAMSNLYTDPDSLAAYQQKAASVLSEASMAFVVDDPEPGLLDTILHEATHNLGPGNSYQVGGKSGDEIFGGPLAAMLEELKSQSGALFLVELLRARGIIDDTLAKRVYTDSIVWAFGHISSGMWTADHDIKTYPQVACIQVGMLMELGVITWDAEATAANGTDKGAFTIHLDKMPAAADHMMKVTAGLKARGDKAGALALQKKYVDSDAVPQKVIVERWLRWPKSSFVFAVEL